MMPIVPFTINMMPIVRLGYCFKPYQRLNAHSAFYDTHDAHSTSTFYDKHDAHCTFYDKHDAHAYMYYHLR